MENLEIGSRAYFLWNRSLGFTVAEKDADVSMPVASLTKMMTALIVLERRELAEEVTITAEMMQGLEEFAVVGLRAGQVVTVEDLLYATMLPSAGDAAQALAMSTSGSIEGFVELMNTKAEELGLTETHFSNPVGFDAGRASSEDSDETNYSTARDIAKLLEAALANPKFREIFETYEKYLPSLGQTVEKTFSSTTYITGGKTGYTKAAGRCLASTATVEGTEYILVTLGAEMHGQNVADAEKIYRMIEEDYEPVRLVREGEKILQIEVEGSATKSLEFTAEQDAVAALEGDVRATELAYDYDGERKITRKTASGSRLGSYTIRRGGDILYVQEIYYENVPAFYNYGVVTVAVAVSLMLLAGAIGGFYKRRKNPRETRWTRIALGCLVAGVLSAVAILVMFRRWFEPGEETEVYRPEANVIVAETGDEEETVSFEPDDNNCTLGYGNLMLINPNFPVDEVFIEARRGQLISISQTYGIQEYHPAGNGDNLMMPEAAEQLNAMLEAYARENPGHTMGTYSCFRSRGTSCGRLCAATGESDHHTGLTCDLIDLRYGSELNTDYYTEHKEWQWLRENSYKYGFIDRFPEAWAGGLMSEPLNVDANGSTGLFETWHYRYVGVEAATEIATGKYNNGRYDSLEHYLKAIGRVADLKAGICK